MRLIPLNKNEVTDISYLKLAINKTHMGPVSEEKVAQAKASALSAAANKVRVMADFTVSVNTDDPSKKDKRNSQNKSYLFTEVGSTPTDVAKSAVLLMQAWDNKYGDQGTPDYVKRLSRALEARASAYGKLGINPNSGSKPQLSAEQRVVYNSVVGPTGFDYYEYHLAFKLEGQTKFVRSKTYRSLQPLDLKSMLNTLSSEVKKLNGNITIKARQTN